MFLFKKNLWQIKNISTWTEIIWIRWPNFFAGQSSKAWQILAMILKFYSSKMSRTFCLSQWPRSISKQTKKHRKSDRKNGKIWYCASTLDGGRRTVASYSVLSRLWTLLCFALLPTFLPGSIAWGQARARALVPPLPAAARVALVGCELPKPSSMAEQITI